MPLSSFHPAVRRWFERAFPAGPSAPQTRGWPAIRSGRHTLISAPTGSGKTLAAFLSAIDELVRDALASGGALPDETRVVYISPLKALGNDIERNLAFPLEGIRAELAEMGLPEVGIRTAVRTGDTPAAERQKHLDRPPHLCVTTPESLYILLTTRRGREMLQTVRTVIVDEIHAVYDDKRGSHLALTLERLDHLTTHGVEGDVWRTAGKRQYVEPTDGRAPAGRAPLRIGLSATVEPIADVARFLVGATRVAAAGPGDGARAGGVADCAVIDEGHARRMELAIEVPGSPLEALLSGEAWTEVYDRIATLVLENRTTIVFVNTRRLAERVSRHLAERLGEERVTSHHGSLSRERRLDAERRLKAGSLRAIVATASLELGIDVGTVDLVIQIGSPRQIGAFLQRVGRSGRVMGTAARGRIFALTRDELVETAALVRAAHAGRLDRLVLPVAPLDLLAQQIVAAAATRDWEAGELFALLVGAWPYRDLPREDFDAVVRMLADGYATARGRRAARIHFDGVNGVIRGRRGARLAAVTSGGAIPDVSDFDVILDPEGTFVGSINEDFAIESLPGDVFQLGNASWRIHKIETGRVRVTDAHGESPTIPFWLGEAPARTAELSEEVSRLREDVAGWVAEGGVDGAAARLEAEIPGLPPEAAVQLAEYVDATVRVLGVVPTQRRLVLERFFDEAGGMQLVLHAPFGGRVNRAWGLALRKRFCRSFDFELQAAANEDAIVLSLGPQHSFPLIDVFHYLKTASARELLIQALLAAPMFQTRWRWNAERSLGVLRWGNGRKVPAQLLRMRSDDLLVAAFPQAAQCFEHIVGDVQVPWEHPIVRQTVEDCLVEAMDVDALEAVLARIEAGELELVARDVPEPSPMCHEVIHARPWAFLDDAPAEERRTLAVKTRRGLDFRTADDLGTLDAAAIERVREEAWPEPEDADEVHDALAWLGLVTDAEAAPWAERLAALAEAGRVARARVADGVRLWVAAERLPEVEAAYGSVRLDPAIAAPEADAAREWDAAEALAAILAGRLEGLGPVTAARVAGELGLDSRRVDAALVELESTGAVLRGRFTPGVEELEWCHRRLLARIHRYTIERLRAETRPVAPADYMRFLFGWHGLGTAAPAEGPRGLLAVLERLQGFEAPAVAWERDLLPARLPGYDPAWLDLLCLGGHLAWGRLRPPVSQDRERPRSGPVRNTPIAFFHREDLADWMALAERPEPAEEDLSHEARTVRARLEVGGPAFVQDLVGAAGLLPAQVERGLAELVSWGLVTADGFEALRTLLTPEAKRRRRPLPRPGRQARYTGAAVAGRWSLLRAPDAPAPADRAAAGDGRLAAEADREARVEAFARQALARYGVVTRRVMAREAPLAPWRETLRVLRRLEMRGEIRGGRFVEGMAGEQFALPEAVEELRAARRKPKDGALVAVAAGDPLNLVGILTPGERVAALPGNRVVYKDGVPVAVKEGRAMRPLREAASDAEDREIHTLLVQRATVRSGAG
ncbi:MAG TPA: DEAD/DEAH box helicase [Gemmatimonadota bacterium]|nr:DEAD/DEAH box helicase [Gemmatimonadota bacterium]